MKTNDLIRRSDEPIAHGDEVLKTRFNYSGDIPEYVKDGEMCRACTGRQVKQLQPGVIELMKRVTV